MLKFRGTHTYVDRVIMCYGIRTLKTLYIILWSIDPNNLIGN